MSDEAGQLCVGVGSGARPDLALKAQVASWSCLSLERPPVYIHLLWGRVDCFLKTFWMPLCLSAAADGILCS